MWLGQFGARVLNPTQLRVINKWIKWDFFLGKIAFCRCCGGYLPPKACCGSRLCPVRRVISHLHGGRWVCQNLAASPTEVEELFGSPAWWPVSLLRALSETDPSPKVAPIFIGLTLYQLKIKLFGQHMYATRKEMAHPEVQDSVKPWVVWRNGYSRLYRYR